MWIAPNLVTLLGFFFILGNVALLELYVPDLVGPVSLRQNVNIMRHGAYKQCRRHHGYTTVSRSVCGCTLLWTMSTASKRAVRELLARLESCLST